MYTVSERPGVFTPGFIFNISDSRACAHYFSIKIGKHFLQLGSTPYMRSKM